MKPGMVFADYGYTAKGLAVSLDVIWDKSDRDAIVYTIYSNDEDFTLKANSIDCFDYNYFFIKKFNWELIGLMETLHGENKMSSFDEDFDFNIEFCRDLIRSYYGI